MRIRCFTVKTDHTLQWTVHNIDGAVYMYCICIPLIVYIHCKMQPLNMVNDIELKNESTLSAHLYVAH